MKKIFLFFIAFLFVASPIYASLSSISHGSYGGGILNDSRYVNVTGDTMTGTLKINSDIIVDGNAHNNSKLYIGSQYLVEDGTYDNTLRMDNFIGIWAPAYIYLGGYSGANPKIAKVTSDTGTYGLMFADNNSQGVFMFTTSSNQDKQHDHGAQSNPTIFIHSALNPNTNNTRWGSLTHTGTAGAAGEFVIATGSGEVNLLPAAGYITQIGDAGSATYMNANDDLFVSGRLEVDGYTYLDNHAVITDNRQIAFGTSSDSVLLHNVTQNPDSLVLGVGAESNSFIIVEKTDTSTNFGHTQQINPTIYLHSSYEADTAQWVGISHRSTEAVVEMGDSSIPLTIKSLLRISPEATCPVTSGTLEGTIWFTGVEMRYWEGNLWSPF